MAIVSMGALFVLGDQLAAALPGLLDRIFGDGANAGGTSSPAAGGGGGGQPTGNTAQNTPGTGTVQVTLSSGQVITMENYPVDLSKAVETAGGNGTTKRILVGFESAIQQLYEAGEINESEANQLQKLANLGHEMAALQKLVEDAADAANGDKKKFLATQIDFRGKTLDVNWMININMSFTGEPGDWANDPLNADTGAWGVMKDFIDEYKRIEKSGMIESAAVNSLVEQLSGDILRIAGAVENTMDRLSPHEDNYDPNADLGEFDHMMASTLTHDNSGGICNAGGGNDTGIHCP